MARASGGANNMQPLSWGEGGTNGKDPRFVYNIIKVVKY